MALCARRFRTLAAAAAAAALTSIAAAGPGGAACTGQSGRQTVTLVELYTSEGCSSCPPADRWLRTEFPGSANAPAVALAFHVDYWDRLGWKDRFASAAYTERQYAAMRANGSRFVYTPQVLVQGKDYPDWKGASRTAIAEAASHHAPRADIALEAAPAGGALAVKATARIADPADRRNAVLYLALTQDGLVSNVKAGENAGIRLAHDHVVRDFRPAAAGTDAAGNLAAQTQLAVPQDGERAFTVVAFVQNAATGDVLQTLALASTECHMYRLE